MLKAMWGVCLLLAAATVAVLVWPSGGAPPGEWGELSTGSSNSGTVLLPNHDGGFEVDSLVGWTHRPRSIEGDHSSLPPGWIDKGQGRRGNAFRLGNLRAKKAEVKASYSQAIRHCDYFFDGFARGQAKSGKAWFGIEVVFEDDKGEPIASYLSYHSEGGAQPEKHDGRLLETMVASEGGWWRLGAHTSAELRQRGLAMPKHPTMLSFNLCAGVEDGETDAWFDDLDLRAMKAGQ